MIGDKGGTHLIYRRKTYRISPEVLEVFTDFFHMYLYPNQIQHGARLVGRWVNESKDEIVAIWEYDSMEHYEQIERMIKQSDLHTKAMSKRKELGELYLDFTQDFLTSTTHSQKGSQTPRHITAVSGFITNQDGEVLLVRNLHRPDTLEMPGGQVEEGETLEEALHREIAEETGATVRLIGMTGIYQNVTSGILCVVFRGEYLSGELQPAEGETSEVVFKNITKENAEAWITRPHFRSRLLDALEPNYLPYEAFRLRPYELLCRYEAKKEFS